MQNMKHRSDFQLAFSGESISKQTQLWNLIKQKGIVSDIIELGRTSTKELALAYHAASVVILPSFYEGFGLSILESMATGTPVIGAASVRSRKLWVMEESYLILIL